MARDVSDEEGSECNLPIDRLIPLLEAVVLADVSEPWLRALIKSGKVQGKKIGRNYVVDIESARAFVRYPFLGRPRRARGANTEGKERDT
jgi:hypothetical protein